MTNYAYLDENSRVISVRLCKDKDKQLKTIAKRLNTNKNQLINKALDHYIAMLEEFGQVNIQY